jgi:membrane protein DedA with SNARE-associated domain
MNLGLILDAIKVWAESIISSMGYPGLTLVMFLENIFPPIPSEVVLPLAGNLTITGRFSLFGVVFWGMIGSLVGALFFYALGKLVGETRLRNFVAKYGKWGMISTDDFDKSAEWFDRYGELTIFFGRMVPIVRSLISIPAGLAKMNIPKFLFYTVIGTSMWNFVLALAGKLLGSQWGLVVEWVGVYQNIVIGLVALAVVFFVVSRLLKRKSAKQVESGNNQ